MIKQHDGAVMPRLGQGTWFMGEDPSLEEGEITSLQTGIAAGMTLIDTAEMYGNGQAESLVGKAIAAQKRENLFLVSKVYPYNAGEGRIFKSCEATLRRLGTDYLDLYLLHWRGSVPLEETIACMQRLVAEGKIRRWGVSNFDKEDMQELWHTKGGTHCAANQVLYHLGSRGIEYDLLPWMQQHNMVTMAYCPLAQAGSLRRGLVSSPAVTALAQKYNVTPYQILLAFVLQAKDVIAIPKAGTPAHVLENAAAKNLHFTAEDMQLLNAAYPPPAQKTSLDIV